MEPHIRFAAPGDVPLILQFIRELAEYERLTDQVVADESTLSESLFCSRPAAEALICEANSQPVGFALFFQNYSTFLGRAGIYLEDLFVRPPFRGRGYGRSLLQFLSQLAVERSCGRLEWSVLDWNEPAIRFYQALGAEPMRDWTVFRLTGEPLRRLAGGDDG